MKIIFFGTSQFAVPALEALMKDADFKIKAVVTETDKPADRKMALRKSPVKILAEEKNLNLLQPEKFDKKTAEKIGELAPDVAVLVAYGKIIPKEILKVPRKGFINIHPSLLPRYRGASPIQSAILSGDKKTGVTIFVLDEKVDRGPILAQKPYEMEGDETTPELKEKLSVLGAEILIPTLKQYVGGELLLQKQNENQATLTKQFSREDGKIDWKKSAEEIERAVRAFNPWPSAWTEIKDVGRVKITKASVLKDAPKNFKSGQFFEYKKGLAVKCEENALLIEKLVPEGKKEMTGEEFLRGAGRLLCK
jgi:methionyl-tRNA formyltransferase